jgi:hypothetical protein
MVDWLRGQVAVVLLMGILIGLVVNYGYFTFVRPPASWHVSADFVVANSNTPGLQIGYSYPNVYNTSTPDLVINSDFWRISWKTIPYYKDATGITLYYAIPGKILVSTSPGFTVYGIYGSAIIGSIDLLDPSSYNINQGGWVPDFREGLTLCFRGNQEIEDVIGYPTLMSGRGSYFISAYNTTGCFNFTIEEYY